ncbi:MAG: AAA family ATPase [Oscillatoriales cyanobacterium SM2_2_1]|nr:AAA family ATPase [Oscillatoriales cyanobacterium SM2_2_1]
MLTRLKVSGFKNLVNVDVRFGAFTCIAGANGVGKSNLFDVIQFLSALSNYPLIEAAQFVRNERGKPGDVRSLFHRVGETYADKIFFEVEMIVPASGEDDLGQQAKASITFLRYSLEIKYRTDHSHRSLGGLEIVREELVHINRSAASKHLLFPHKVNSWRDTTVIGKRSARYFISTEGEGDNKIIHLHQDGGSRGRPLSSAANLPRTVLSVANAAESPTALMAKREMQSWRLLQLEPSCLRQPDELTAPSKLNSNGSHLPATLYRLASQNGIRPETIYSQIANTLADLIEDVDSVIIDNDPKRQLLTLQVKSQNGTIYPARSLSDGTLRFLALAVLKLDPEAKGLICLEEPENGIHPARIPKILQLLKEIATDTEEEVGADNPLRQVIINTHSPVVVQEVSDDSLLIAELRESIQVLKDIENDTEEAVESCEPREFIQGEQRFKRFKRVCFSYLDNTWRTKAKEHENTNIVAKGNLLAYLNPVPARFEENGNAIGMKENTGKQYPPRSRRVREREDLLPLIPGFELIADESL